MVNKRARKEVNGTLLLRNSSRVAKHYTNLFTDELFETEKSSGAPGINKAAPKRRKVKLHPEPWETFFIVGEEVGGGEC